MNEEPLAQHSSLPKVRTPLSHISGAVSRTPRATVSSGPAGDPSKKPNHPQKPPAPVHLGIYAYVVMGHTPGSFISTPRKCGGGGIAIGIRVGSGERGREISEEKQLLQ